MARASHVNRSLIPTEVAGSFGEPFLRYDWRHQIGVHAQADIPATTSSVTRTAAAVSSAERMGNRRSGTKPTPAIFYGYPVELIQLWCGVSQHTAYLYKIGARKPSRQALRLFTLHRDGRVLGPEWRDWAIQKDRLVSPEGQETTQNQLAAYWLIMQLVRELASRDPEAREEFNRLLRSA